MDAHREFEQALDPRVTCSRCQILFVFENKPLHRKPYSELLLTAVVIPAAAYAWFHYRDAGAVLAVLALLGWVFLLWFSWTRGCDECTRIRNAGSPREGAGDF